MVGVGGGVGGMDTKINSTETGPWRGGGGGDGYQNKQSSQKVDPGGGGGGGGMDTKINSTESGPWQRKFSCRFCGDSNLGPFITNPVLCLAVPWFT